MNKLLAEFIGTFMLVLVGCGTATISGRFIGNVGNVVGVGNTGIAFAFGLTVMAMVYAIGNISGCHINPAITISTLVAGRMKAIDAVFYIIAQCLGAIAGAGVLLVIASGNADYSLAAVGLGQNGYGVHSPGGYSLTTCFISETVFTVLFVLVVLGSTHKDAPRGFAGVAIGFTLVAILLVSIPLTGASVNPARSLGPAVWVGGAALSQLWMFIVAPILGGIIAALIWRFGLEGRESRSPTTKNAGR